MLNSASRTNARACVRASVLHKILGIIMLHVLTNRLCSRQCHTLLAELHAVRAGCQCGYGDIAPRSSDHHVLLFILGICFVVIEMPTTTKAPYLAGQQRDSVAVDGCRAGWRAAWVSSETIDHNVIGW